MESNFECVAGPLHRVAAPGEAGGGGCSFLGICTTDSPAPCWILRSVGAAGVQGGQQHSLKRGGLGQPLAWREATGRMRALHTQLPGPAVWGGVPCRYTNCSRPQRVLSSTLGSFERG